MSKRKINLKEILENQIDTHTLNSRKLIEHFEIKQIELCKKNL